MVPEYIMVQKTKCPHCKSLEVVKRGYFQTEAHGKQQRYFCKKCNKKFIERTGFYRMRNNEKKITLSSVTLPHPFWNWTNHLNK